MGKAESRPWQVSSKAYLGQEGQGEPAWEVGKCVGGCAYT
jgi:hypothetical protein